MQAVKYLHNEMWSAHTYVVTIIRKMMGHAIHDDIEKPLSPSCLHAVGRTNKSTLSPSSPPQYFEYGDAAVYSTLADWLEIFRKSEALHRGTQLTPWATRECMGHYEDSLKARTCCVCFIWSAHSWKTWPVVTPEGVALGANAMLY